MTKNKEPLHSFTLEEFKKNTEEMIADSTKSYNPFADWERIIPIRDYDEDTVKHTIENGSLNAKRILSYNYFNKNGFYKEIISYYSTLLKYANILIPNPIQGKSLQDTPLKKKYFQANEFLQKIRIEEIGPRIAFKVLLFGSYYGAVQTANKKDFTLMDLPYKYCRSRFLDKKGNKIVEFNVKFFNTISDEENRKAALKVYPEVVRKYYYSWRRDKKKTSWVFLPSNIGVCFELFDERPYFLSIIPATIEYDKAVDTEQQKNLEKIKKLLVHKIPHLNDGTLLFEPQEVQIMHNGVVNMLKGNNPYVSVLTTYGDVDVDNTKTTDSVSNNILENMENGIYAEAGVSKEVFNATSSASLSTSLKYDLSLMMVLANKIAIFFSTLINSLYGNGNLSFTFRVLPISYYNEEDYINSYFKLASSGYSFLLPAAVQGITPLDLMNLKEVENDVLKLHEILLPLMSSYTQSGNGQKESEAPTEEGGRPRKKEEEKAEQTVKNRESSKTVISEE